MDILWVCPSFLHPTDRGGQIRSLGMLRELHRRHNVHFAALNPPSNFEGLRRAHEYCSTFTVVEHLPPRRSSPRFLPQVLFSPFNSQPLAISRYASKELRRALSQLLAERQFDVVVCDFLAAAPNIPDITSAVLFQHNVETTIWNRHHESSAHPIKRAFFKMQARKMEKYERTVCQQAHHVIAVSAKDAEVMKQLFGIEHVEAVPTGVDVEYFRPPQAAERTADLIFSGSMDWLPNVDAIEYFLGEIFPQITAQRPETTFVIAGRSPDPRVLKAAEPFPGVTVTGSVPDMRPYLWGSRVSIVPLRIGGGTRLKIYESMASGSPVVSTTIGAEGLDHTDGKDILIADEPDAFAASCLRILENPEIGHMLAESALELVEQNFSWASVTRQFESILETQRHNGIFQESPEAALQPHWR